MKAEVSKNRHCEGAKRPKQSIILRKSKIDCHEFAGANSRNDESSPSLAEGVRGWVDSTSTAQAKLAIASNADISSLRASEASVSIHKKEMDCFVVASPLPRNDEKSRSFFSNDGKISIRQFDKSYNDGVVDCHDSASAESRNDEKCGLPRLAKGKSRNDAVAKNTHPQTPSAKEGAFEVAPHANNANTPCHTEGVARSISKNISKDSADNAKSSRDISLILNMTKKSMTTKNDNPTKSRKLALSLLTASALASTSLELVAANCVQKNGGTGIGSYLDCTGNMTPQDLQTAINNKNMLINLGRGEGAPLNIGAGTVTATISSNLVFRTVNAPNTDFNITGNNNAGLLLPYTLGNHTANASTIRSLTVSGTINNQSWGSDEVYGSGVKIPFDVHAGTQIGRREADGTLIGGITINSGASITSGAMAIYGGYAGGTRSTFVSQITNNGSIQTLNLGYYKFSGDYATLLGNYYIKGSGTISNLNVYQATLTLNSNGSAWSGHTINGGTTSTSQWHSGDKSDEHIAFAGTISNVGTIGEGAIRINIGEGVTDGTQTYQYKNIILDKSGAKGNSKVTFESLRAGLGTQLHRAGNDGFKVSADVSTSYGSSMWRTLSLSYARRSIMVQNIIDTMTTKTFHSDRYYNQEVELRLLQYDMSRLTNRSSKFAKQTRKNQAKVDKMRDKLAKLTLEQSKGQNLDKGYNNFELIDQLDAIFIPYTGRRDWRVFFVPYAAHSYSDMGESTATEWAGGAIGGVQRNLKGQGILTSYLTYEYAHATTEMLGAQAIMQTNALQGGVSYFKIFPITGKVWEATLKASGRVGVDMPLLSAQSPLPNIKFNLASDKKGLATPLMWSLGAEVRGGLTFYQFKQNSYVSPEVGLSYDVLSPLGMKLEKAKYGLGGNEYYPSQYWHLPQLSGSVKYYKVYGNKFRTNFVAGLRYNILNTPTGRFRIGGLAGEGKIYLPAVYGYLDLDLIWVVKKNHELSAGYNGVFYANKFGKDVMDKFNGVSTSINFKYAHWFGGTDYVTDADGNAISRSIAEGSKKKKSKKSKPKKSKKSKKKVYYIDG